MGHSMPLKFLSFWVSSWFFVFCTLLVFYWITPGYDRLDFYITGYTNSQTGIATTGASNPNHFMGTDDAFLVKFNSNGSYLLSWPTLSIPHSLEINEAQNLLCTCGYKTNQIECFDLD